MLEVHDIHIRIENAMKYTIILSAEPEIPLVGKTPAKTVIEKSSLVVKEGFISSADLRDLC